MYSANPRAATWWRWKQTPDEAYASRCRRSSSSGAAITMVVGARRWKTATQRADQQGTEMPSKATNASALSRRIESRRLKTGRKGWAHMPEKPGYCARPVAESIRALPSGARAFVWRARPGIVMVEWHQPRGHGRQTKARHRSQKHESTRNRPRRNSRVSPAYGPPFSSGLEPPRFDPPSRGRLH